MEIPKKEDIPSASSQSFMDGMGLDIDAADAATAIASPPRQFDAINTLGLDEWRQPERIVVGGGLPTLPCFHVL